MRIGSVVLRRLQAKLYAAQPQTTISSAYYWVRNIAEIFNSLYVVSRGYASDISNRMKKLAVHSEVNGSEHRHLRVLVPFYTR